MKKCKHLYLAIIFICIFPFDGMSIEIDNELRQLFFSSFLDEKDFKNTMKLVEDKRNSGNDTNSNSYCLLEGGTYLSGLPTATLSSFREHHSLFKTKNEAKRYFEGLIKNNSATRPPHLVSKNEVGDIAYLWCFDVGTLSNELTYFAKYFILKENLVLFLGVEQKPFKKSTPKENILLKIVPNYGRIAVGKSSLVLDYFNRKEPDEPNLVDGLKRGIKIQKLPHSN